MKLRELALADASWCAELEQLLFPGDSPWSVEEFQSEIAHALTKYFGVEISGRLVGYAGMAVLGPPDDVECEIRTIAVDPTYQGRGVGKLFMDAFTRIADAQDAPIFLEVRTDNEPAMALYHSYGFATIGVRRGYYMPSGADAYTMLRPRSSEKDGAEP